MNSRVDAVRGKGRRRRRYGMARGIWPAQRVATDSLAVDDGRWCGCGVCAAALSRVHSVRESRARRVCRVRAEHMNVTTRVRLCARRVRV